jgi:hypothetical protein
MIMIGVEGVLAVHALCGNRCVAPDDELSVPSFR